jgi:DNA-binding response OmpR family regulator
MNEVEITLKDQEITLTPAEARQLFLVMQELFSIADRASRADSDWQPDPAGSVSIGGHDYQFVKMRTA